jgi:hypothetical protein
MRRKRTVGLTRYFRATQMIDEAIQAKQAQLEAVGERPTTSSIILKALLESPYLFDKPGNT